MLKNTAPQPIPILDPSAVAAPNQYINLFLQAHVAIGILRGPHFIIELANDHLLRIWGKSRSILGMPVLEALPEVKDTQYPGLLQQVLETGITHHAQESSAMLVRDGRHEQVYFNFVYQPLYNSPNQVNGVMIIAHEVTEQVEARKKVEESERRFRNLVEEAEVATAIYMGIEMKIELANDAMLRLWGKEGSVIGKTVREALPELEGQPFHQLLEHVFTSGQTYRATEDRADLVVDGRLQTFYFNFSYKPLRNSAGEVYAILNMATDVTELVKAKQELARSEGRLRLAADIAELGTWDYYPGATEICWDDRCRELYGFAPGVPSEVAFNNNMIHPDDRELVLRNFELALSPGSSGAFYEEYRIIRQGDGAIRYLRSKGQTSFNKDGSPHHISGTLQDITDQQLKASILENKVEERTAELKAVVAQLQESNQELEQFAHVASHDMKEPIRKARLFADRLHTEYGQLLPDKGLVYLEKIENAALRMTTMVEGVLHYSMLNSQPQPYQPILLHEVLAGIEQDLELLMSQKGARLSYGSFPAFEGAPVLIYQLFYNLVNNSLKFASAERPAHIDISYQIPAADDAPAQSIEIMFTDNGIGFEPSEAAYIFQTFSRLHPRDKYEGTGLGLALCRKIVSRHLGSIQATGKPGQGATFIINLPLRQPLGKTATKE